MVNMLSSDGKTRTVKELEEKAIKNGMIPDYWDDVSLLNVKPQSFYYGPKLPTLELNPYVTDIFDFVYEDIKILNYNPMPTISAEVSV